jgi:membrane-associated phospholipid phosphatase
MSPSMRIPAAIIAVAGIAFVLALGFVVRLKVIAEEFDGEWMEEIVELRAPHWEFSSRMLDFVGGGWFALWVVPMCGVAVLLLLRRPWSALAFALTLYVTVGVSPLLKWFFGRARPEEILVQVETAAFPSGHVAHAAAVAVALALISARWQVVVVGAAYVVLMALSRTYLGAHWVSDTLGGALLGASVALGVWAIFASRLHSERKAAPPELNDARALNDSQ